MFVEIPNQLGKSNPILGTGLLYFLDFY